MENQTPHKWGMKGSLWTGSWVAKGIFLVVAFLALVAFGITGSVYRAGVVMVEGGSKGLISWEAVHTAFHGDFLGKRGIVISGLKTLFAVVIAFVVARKFPSVIGEMSVRVAGVELSGAQSAAMMWCMVFVLVKWL